MSPKTVVATPDACKELERITRDSMGHETTVGGKEALAAREKELRGMALSCKVSDVLAIPSREQAFKAVGVVAGEVLREETGINIPVYVASSVDDPANPAVPNFFNTILERMINRKEKTLTDTLMGMRPEEITAAWSKAREDVARGVGEGIYTSRLDNWAEMADALGGLGHAGIASAVDSTRARIRDFAVECGLPKFSESAGGVASGEDGVAFVCPAGDWTPAQALEIALHEGEHVRCFRDALKNRKLMTFLGVDELESIRGTPDLGRRLSSNPDLQKNYFRRLDGIILDGICSELGVAKPEGSTLVEASNATLTGEGLASYAGQEGMTGVGQVPAFKYNNDVYALGVKMWRSVMMHARNTHGLDEETVTRALMSPYQREDATTGLVGVVELFQHRRDLKEFLSQVA
jgi:hypothetical protein